MVPTGAYLGVFRGAGSLAMEEGNKEALNSFLPCSLFALATGKLRAKFHTPILHIWCPFSF